MAKKSFLIVLSIVLVIVIAAALVISNKSISGFFLGAKKQASTTPAIAINYNNIESIMSRNSIVNDLPENSQILLRFYNFNSGEKEWEKSYILKKGEVKEGHTDIADLVILIHSKYLNGLTNKNFCSMVQTAQANGDFGIESELSTAKLLWKFRGMLEYRECFGF